MSIIFFEASELGNLLAYVSPKLTFETKSLSGKDYINLARALVEYSECNAKCYANQYDEDYCHVSLKELCREAEKLYPMKVSPIKAKTTATLLRYNLYDNNGKDFATKEALDIIITVLSCFIPNDR